MSLYNQYLEDRKKKDEADKSSTSSPTPTGSIFEQYQASRAESNLKPSQLAAQELKNKQPDKSFMEQAKDTLSGVGQTVRTVTDKLGITKVQTPEENQADQELNASVVQSVTSGDYKKFSQLTIVPAITKRIKDIDDQLASGKPQNEGFTPDLIPIIPEEKIANKAIELVTGNKNQGDALIKERKSLQDLMNGDVAELADQRKQVAEGKMTQDEYDRLFAKKQVDAMVKLTKERYGKEYAGGATGTFASFFDLTQLQADKYLQGGDEPLVKDKDTAFNVGVKAVSKISKVLGGEKVAESLSKRSEAKADNLRKWAELTKPSDPNFADTLAEGFGSSAPFMVVGGVVGKAAQVLGVISPTIAAWFAAGASGVIEAGTESGNTYKDNLAQGKSKTEAIQKADMTFWGNVGLNIVLDKFGIQNLDEERMLKRFMLSGPSEGLQELSQQVISNVNSGKPFDEGVIESGVVGWIIGSSSAVATPTLTAEEETIENAVPTTTPPTGTTPIDPPAPPAASEVSQIDQQPAQIDTPASNAVQAQQAENVPSEQGVASDNQVQPTQNPSSFQYKPATNLDETQKGVETRFGEYLTNNLEQAEADYREKFGNVLNTDNARELSPEYNASRNLMSPAVHEPASAFIQQLYKKSLLEPVKPGEEPVILFTAGGTGTGKTTAIKTRPEFKEMAETAHIVYDTNLGGYESSVKKIDLGLESELPIKIAYVVRDPVESMDQGVITRAVNPDNGRTVPSSVHIGTHIESLATIQKIAEHYKDNPLVEITVIDNNFGKGNARVIPLEDLKKINYNEVEIGNTIQDHLDTHYENGKITKEIYKGIAGKDPKVQGVEQKERSAAGKKPQQPGLTVAQANKKLQDYYIKQFDSSEFQQAHADVMAELEIAEAGKRMFNENGEFIGASESTFPDWVSPELRSRELFDEVLSGLANPAIMEYPPNHMTRRQALYDEVLAQIDARSNLNGSDIISEIKEAYANKKTIDKAAKINDRSLKRSERAERSEKIKSEKSLNDDIEKYISKRKTVKFREVADEAADPLIQEAKKYGSADEFVKAQPKVFHGGSGVDELNKNFRIATTDEKLKFATSGGNFEGLSLTTDKNIAKQYSRSIGNTERVLEVYKNPNAKVYEIDTKGDGIDDVVDLQEIKSQGYDAVQDIGKNAEYEYRALTNNAVKTKSQLTDLWNEANKANKKEEPKNLIAQHNISPAGILHADKMGGLPLPSIAISRKEHPLSGFGEITLIANNRLYDPALKSNKVFNADAYTPRYPSVTYMVDSKKAEAALDPIIADVEGYYKDSHFSPRYLDTRYKVSGLLDSRDFESNGQRALADDFLLQGYFAKQKGATPDSDITEVNAIVRKNQTEFDSFINDLFTEIDPKEKLFKGFTYSGSRKYQEHSLENVVKTMKSEMKTGESFIYGVGSVRAKVAEKFTKLSQIKSNRNNILSSTEISKIKSSYDSKWENLINKGTNEYKSGDASTFTQVVIDGIKNRNLAGELKEFGYNTDILPELNSFLDELRNAPSEYFEVKVQRSVELSEFSGAIVPIDTSQRVIDVLEKNGLKIVKYDPKIEQRSTKIQENFERELFRVKDDVKQFTGRTITDEQESELIALNKKIFGDEDVKITLQIMANTKALGSSKDGMITIVDGQADPKDTFYHEAVHKYIDVFTTREEQIALFKAGVEKYGTSNLNQVEENIAEDFINYAKSRESITGKIAGFFEKILNRVNIYFGNQNEIEALYQNILSGNPDQKISTSQNRREGVIQPAITPTNKTKQSTSYKKQQDYQVRVEGRLREEFQNNINYQTMNMAEEAAKGIAFSEEFPDRALRVAKGMELPPAGYTVSGIAIAVSDKAKADGNGKLHEQIENSHSLRLTRAGQEIVMNRGRVDENRAENFRAQVLKARLEAVNNTKLLFFSVPTNVKGSLTSVIDKTKTKSQRAVEMIDKKAATLKQTIDKATLSKLGSAQSILDKLTCKI